MQAHPQLGIAEIADLVRLVVLLHRVEAPGTQSYADGVRALRQQRRDVVAVVQDRLPVVRGVGRKDVLAHFLSVDAAFIEAKAADVQGGLAHAPVQGELRTQVSGAEAAVLRLHIPGERRLPADPIRNGGQQQRQ